jgi:hypothetical protein
MGCFQSCEVIESKAKTACGVLTVSLLQAYIEAKECYNEKIYAK